MVLNDGDKVTVEYEGKLDSGEVFDSTEKSGKPLIFVIGARQVIPGFEKQVKGMKKGDEKEFKLKSEDAYGEKKEEMMKKVPKSSLPEGQEPQKGMMLALKSQDGRQFPARITEVDKESITIDLNHPLAGQNLNFKVKIVEVESVKKA